MFGYLRIIVSMRPIDIFGGRKNKYWVPLHLPEQVQRAFDVRAKAGFSFGGVFAEMCSEMYDDVVIGDSGSVRDVEHVELRTAREIISFKEPTNVRAQVPAAACDKNFQTGKSEPPAVASG